jgi:hypothetical protein
MKIVIACPPIRDFYTTPHRMASLGTEALRKRLTAAGHEVVLFNFAQGDGGWRKKTNQQTRGPCTSPGIPLPKELSYLKPYIIENETGPVSFFTKYRHWGLEYSHCARQIVNEGADLVCISSFAYAYAEEAVQLSREVKKIQPQVFILAGGAGPSVNPQYYLEKSGINAVLSGEGEESLQKFVELFERSSGGKTWWTGFRGNALGAEVSEILPGLVLQSQRTRSMNQKIRIIDSMPDPIFVKINGNGKKQYYSVSVTRGCPNQCRFCANHLIHGRVYRKASLEKIENALLFLKRQIEDERNAKTGTGIHFNFEDDNLLCDADFLLRVCGLSRKYFPGISFSAENGLDYMLLSPSLADQLIAAGFTQFNLSFVAAASTSLEDQNRGFNTARFGELVNHIAARGIPVISYFIAGFGTDTIRGIAQSLAYLAALPTRIGLSAFYAVPGLPGFEDPKRFTDRPPRLCLGSSLYPWAKTISTQSLYTVFRLSRILNLLKAQPSAYEGKIFRLLFTKKCVSTIINDKKNTKIIPVTCIDEELVEYMMEELETRNVHYSN